MFKANGGAKQTNLQGTICMKQDKYHIKNCWHHHICNKNENSVSFLYFLVSLSLFEQPVNITSPQLICGRCEICMNCIEMLA